MMLCRMWLWGHKRECKHDSPSTHGLRLQVICTPGPVPGHDVCTGNCRPGGTCFYCTLQLLRRHAPRQPLELSGTISWDTGCDWLGFTGGLLASRLASDAADESCPVL